MKFSSSLHHEGKQHCQCRWRYILLVKSVAILLAMYTIHTAFKLEFHYFQYSATASLLQNEIISVITAAPILLVPSMVFYLKKCRLISGDIYWGEKNAPLRQIQHTGNNFCGNNNVPVNNHLIPLITEWDLNICQCGTAPFHTTTITMPSQRPLLCWLSGNILCLTCQTGVGSNSTN